eukprot:15480032-Alexandrium_andersonii.AAC.1
MHACTHVRTVACVRACVCACGVRAYVHAYGQERENPHVRAHARAFEHERPATHTPSQCTQALVNGCLRLQGSAKAIELAAFIQETARAHCCA